MKDLFSLLADRKQALLGWAELADPMVIGLMARAGFDAILLDGQHGAHDLASAKACITEAALCGVPVLVRVEVEAASIAARMLDVGAAGVVAPMINTPEDARRFVTEVKYPPIGNRSWGPTRAMQIAGESDGPTFLKQANHRTAALAMLETRVALDNLDAILDVAGLDGILVGPADLSIALSGGSLDPNGAPVRSAMSEILNKTRQRGKLACAFGGPSSRAAELLAEGYQLVSAGYDTGLISAAFQQAVAETRK